MSASVSLKVLSIQQLLYSQILNKQQQNIANKFIAFVLIINGQANNSTESQLVHAGSLLLYTR